MIGSRSLLLRLFIRRLEAVNFLRLLRRPEHLPDAPAEQQRDAANRQRHVDPTSGGHGVPPSLSGTIFSPRRPNQRMPARWVTIDRKTTVTRMTPTLIRATGLGGCAALPKRSRM